MSDDDETTVISTTVVHETITTMGGGGGGGYSDDDDDDDDDCCDVGGKSGGGGDQKPHRIYTKVGPQFAMTIRDGYVVLAPSDPCDERQHWIKDRKYGAGKRDEEGFPSFALINKGSGEALKHNLPPDHVLLVPFDSCDPDDESLLWTNSQLFGDGFTTIRKMNNIKHNLDAWVGGEENGMLRDGSKVVLFDFTMTPNQLWKIERY